MVDLKISRDRFGELVLVVAKGQLVVEMTGEEKPSTVMTVMFAGLNICHVG